jgi:DinB superfamily
VGTSNRIRADVLTPFYTGTTLQRLDPILESLAEAQRTLLRAADTILADQWKQEPSEGRWSAGAVAVHLVMVERAVLGAADRITRKGPPRLSFWHKLRLPPALVEKRFVRVKSAISVDLQTVNGKEEALAELREVRSRTLAFLDETKGRDLSSYRWRHPLLGWLNAYEWFEFVAAHQVRHSKQMREIAKALPKNVESLQK